MGDSTPSPLTRAGEQEQQGKGKEQIETTGITSTSPTTKTPPRATTSPSPPTDTGDAKGDGYHHGHSHPQPYSYPPERTSLDASTSTASQIEPDLLIDDEGYQASTTTSYVTSLASDIRRGVEENGRVYASYGIHKPWVPVDDREVSCY